MGVLGMGMAPNRLENARVPDTAGVLQWRGKWYQLAPYRQVLKRASVITFDCGIVENYFAVPLGDIKVTRWALWH